MHFLIKFDETLFHQRTCKSLRTVSQSFNYYTDGLGEGWFADAPAIRIVQVL